MTCKFVSILQGTVTIKVPEQLSGTIRIMLYVSHFRGSARNMRQRERETGQRTAKFNNTVMPVRAHGGLK